MKSMRMVCGGVALAVSGIAADRACPEQRGCTVRQAFAEERDIEGFTDFAINKNTVRNMKRKFRNFIKLDTQIEIKFSGYNPDIVAVSWMGYDQPRNLGRGETGGSAALPIWIDYMETVLKDTPQTSRELPAGIVTMPTAPVAAPAGEGKLVPEFFYEEAVPPPEVLRPPAPLPLPVYEPPAIFEQRSPPPS